MDFVCASPCAHQYCSVRSLRRSFASVLTEFSLLNSVIRLLRGEIAEFRVLVVAGYRVSVDTLVRCVGENIDFRLYPDSLRALFI